MWPEGYKYRDVYDAVEDQDTTLDYDTDAPSLATILKATNQWQPEMNEIKKPMEVLMLSEAETDKPKDPNVNADSRIDPTYKVNFTQSHCGSYGLKIAKTLVNSYSDIIA